MSSKPNGAVVAAVPAPQSDAVVVRRSNSQADFRKMLEQMAPAMRQVLPKHLTPERIMKVALSATARNPNLFKCSMQSLARAVMQGAELGLEAGGLLGEAYIVPYGETAQMIPGYRGLIKLARQSGHLASIEAHVVMSTDHFEVEYGLTPKLVHRPDMGRTEKEGTLIQDSVLCVYAVARFRDGGTQQDVMSRGDVERIRKRSKAANGGPWVTDWVEMAKKTVVRRLCKYLPLSPELQKALEISEAVETDVDASTVMDIVFPQDEPEAPAMTRSEGLKAQLAEKAGVAMTHDPVTGEVPMPREPGSDG